MTANLTRRIARLTIGDRVINVGEGNTTALHFTFGVERDTSSDPSECSLTVLNLSDENRQKLSKGDQVVLEVGYASTGLFKIFVGDISTVQSFNTGSDNVTEITAEDGGLAVRTGRLNKSYRDGTTWGEVIKDIANAMGLKAGNIDEKISLINTSSTRQISPTIKMGFVIRGQCYHSLNKITKEVGLNWSIQNGAIQLLEHDGVARVSAVLLRGSKNGDGGTGLIGAPRITEVDKKKVVQAVSLIQPGLEPGLKFELDSSDELVRGTYKIVKSVYSGSTEGGEWYVALEGRPKQ